jgi:SAM-dependent methyltransferase
MRDFSDPAFFGDLYAHEYDQTTVLDPAPAVGFLAGLARGGGRVLELASGTGRVAIPLAGRGIAVEGVEGSAAMVGQMRAKPGGELVPAVVGDMADVPVTGPFQLAYLVYNTLFNLPSQQRQTDCFRNVAKVLAVTYQRMTFDSGGITMRPLRLRYCWPSELDLMAQLAGMRLRDRYQDWDGSPFTAESQQHISVYELI